MNSQTHKLVGLYFVCWLLACIPAGAQPSWVKKASKSVFTLKTFNAEGDMIGTSTGFYVGTGGEALSCFAPFRGASRALVVDAAGKVYTVSLMLGANDTYDVARFRVDAGKTQPMEVGDATVAENTGVWLMTWRETKNIPHGSITKTETFQDGYGYYTVAMQTPAEAVGAPLLDDEGRVVAIMQTAYKTGGSDVGYAVSARFADSLRIGGLSINDPALRSTSIKKALPTDLAQAQLTLYLAAAQADTAAYATLLDDFIAAFPKAHDGYVARAQLHADEGRCDLADSDMAEALRVTGHPDEVHHSYSRMIYDKVTRHPNSPTPQPPNSPTPWSLERALSEAQAAWEYSPQPVYRQQEAAVLADMKRYSEAYTLYEELMSSPLRSPQLFFDASRCKAMEGDTLAQIALLDSCLAFFSKPYLKEAAPFLLANAYARIDARRYRQAVALLGEYEKLMSLQVNDRFYYLRFQAEVGGRLFQQALNDIEKAVSMAPQNGLYQAEKASLEIRVGRYEEAEQTARECLRIDPEHSDGYLFLGLAQCLKGSKEEGLENLRKALQLGDTQAEELIAKYGDGE